MYNKWLNKCYVAITTMSLYCIIHPGKPSMCPSYLKKCLFEQCVSMYDWHCLTGEKYMK